MAGKIRDDMISASSSRDAAHSPQTARLGGSGSWMPSRDDVSQHLQIDLLTPHYVTGVTTQGHATAPLYVKNFRVLYSTDGVNWNVYQEVKEVDKVRTWTGICVLHLEIRARREQKHVQCRYLAKLLPYL